MSFLKKQIKNNKELRYYPYICAAVGICNSTLSLFNGFFNVGYIIEYSMILVELMMNFR